MSSSLQGLGPLIQFRKNTDTSIVDKQYHDVQCLVQWNPHSGHYRVKHDFVTIVSSTSVSSMSIRFFDFLVICADYPLYFFLELWMQKSFESDCG